MVNCGTGVVAEHILRGRWMVGIDIGGVDEVPFLVLLEVVDLRRPAVVGVGGVFRGLEDEFDFGRVPVTVKLLVVRITGRRVTDVRTLLLKRVTLSEVV